MSALDPDIWKVASWGLAHPEYSAVSEAILDRTENGKEARRLYELARALLDPYHFSPTERARCASGVDAGL